MPALVQDRNSWAYFFHCSLSYIHVRYKNPINLNQHTVITEHISTNSRETPAGQAKKRGARKARVTTDTTAEE